MASFGIDPSITSTNGSSSPRSALKNHSRKSSAPPTGPHSKSMSGQWTAILGRPGNAPRAISSMLGCVAAVSATESPSQLNPALIQRTWTTASSVGVSVAVKIPSPVTAARGCAARCSLSPHLGKVNGCLLHRPGHGLPIDTPCRLGEDRGCMAMDERGSDGPAANEAASRFGLAPPRRFMLPAILLLLSERPSYGYALVPRLRDFRFGHVDRPAVYRALARLEQ